MNVEDCDATEARQKYFGRLHKNQHSNFIHIKELDNDQPKFPFNGLKHQFLLLSNSNCSL